MKSAHEAFRDLFLNSKKKTTYLQFWDAVDKYEKTYNLKAPHKSLNSFRSTISYYKSK